MTINVALAWADFKDRVDNNQLSINYADKFDNYYLYSSNNSFEYVCILDKDDASDFEDNYKESATII